MTWLLRFVLFLVLFLLVRSLLGRLFRPRAQVRTNPSFRQQPTMRAVGMETVKDPCCGTYVEKSLALPYAAGGTTLYFCSDECRSRYQAQHGK
jgi:YHS domain-containing protein